MLDKCRLCGKIIRENRSKHLRDIHGIETYKGAIRDYFIDSRFERDTRGIREGILEENAPRRLHMIS